MPADPQGCSVDLQHFENYLLWSHFPIQWESKQISSSPCSLISVYCACQNVSLRKCSAIKYFHKTPFSGSFSERADHREQEPTTCKEEETNVLSSVVPASQVPSQKQDSGEVHKPVLPAVEKFTSGQTQLQQMIDKHIKEANMMTEKTDLQGKMILNNTSI